MSTKDFIKDVINDENEPSLKNLRIINERREYLERMAADEKNGEQWYYMDEYRSDPEAFNISEIDPNLCLDEEYIKEAKEERTKCIGGFDQYTPVYLRDTVGHDEYEEWREEGEEIEKENKKDKEAEIFKQQ